MQAAFGTVQDAFGTVLFVVVGVGVVVAIVSLLARKGLYDEIGSGGFAPPAPPAHGAAASAERDAEIRQMLEARNARRAARGEAPLDVEVELAELMRPAPDSALREEVRTLVEARNARLVARGRPPLDVEEEVERRLRDLGG